MFLEVCSPIPVDVVRVTFYENCFFDPVCCTIVYHNQYPLLHSKASGVRFSYALI